MDGVLNGSSFTISLMLIIVIILISVNILEIVNLKDLWEKSLKTDKVYYDKCLNASFILRAFFIFYSFSATISIFMLVFGLILNSAYLYRKFTRVFIDFNCFVFGPGLVIPSFIGFLNFNNFSLGCEIRLTSIHLVYNISNSFSIVISFLIGITIWILKCLYDSMTFYSNTLTRHPEGCSLVRQIFSLTILKFRRNNLHTNNENNSTNSNRINSSGNSLNETGIRIENINNLNNLDKEANSNFNRLENNRNESYFNSNLIGNNTNNLVNRVNENIIVEEEEKLDGSFIDKNSIISKNLEYLNRIKQKNSIDNQKKECNILLEEVEEESKVFINNSNNYGNSISNIDLSSHQINNINNTSNLNNTNNGDDLIYIDDKKISN